MTPPLTTTLAALADALRSARDPWWIIGSAAVALHGADAGVVGDVDVLTSHRDAAMLCATQNLQIASTTPVPPTPVPPSPGPPTPGERFRSRLFARWTAPPLAVEVMADLAVSTQTGWHRVRPTTRVPLETDGGPIFIPSADEMIAILHLFGRDKDLGRAVALIAR